MQSISDNLQHRLQRGEYREVADGVFAAEGALLAQYVVSDTRQGPILLDAQASVGPYTFLRGPAYVGPKTRIIEHSAIKDAVSVGHTVKIGGEVEASVIEPYTNKQHHAVLGRRRRRHAVLLFQPLQHCHRQAVAAFYDAAAVRPAEILNFLESQDSLAELIKAIAERAVFPRPPVQRLL